MTYPEGRKPIQMTLDDELALAAYLLALHGDQVDPEEFVEANAGAWSQFRVACLAPLATLVKIDSQHLNAEGYLVLSVAVELEEKRHAFTHQSQFLNEIQNALWALTSAFSNFEPVKKQGLLGRLTSKPGPLFPQVGDDGLAFYASWPRCPRLRRQDTFGVVTAYLSLADEDSRMMLARLFRPVAAMMCFLRMNFDCDAQVLRDDRKGSDEFERLRAIESFVSRKLGVQMPQPG